MNRRSMRQFLIREGWEPIRKGKHETFAKNGHHIIIPSSGKELNWRLEKFIMIQIRRAARPPEPLVEPLESVSHGNKLADHSG